MSNTPSDTPAVHEIHVQVPCRDTFLPGILAQAEPDRHSKEIALVLHGQMAHKNQMYVAQSTQLAGD